MSNLYKQYLVNSQQNKTRVIDANDLLKERQVKEAERQLAWKRHQEMLAQGFSSGIITSDTQIIEEVEEIDVVAEAQAEAERILAEAQAEAERLVNNAQAESGRIRETAKQQGYAEGAKVREQELEKLQKRLEADYTYRCNTLEKDYTQKRDCMEEELVDVILEVFNKVFHIQFDNKKHILMHLINDAILNIEGDKKFRVRVADSNVLFLENHREDMIERIGNGMELEFIADSTMEGNDCLIETDSGVFDCSLGTQLENLIKDIRSLCS